MRYMGNTKLSLFEDWEVGKLNRSVGERGIEWRGQS